MTPVFDRRIDHPAAWTAAGLGSREALARHLTTAELAAFDTLVARTRSRPPQALEREEVTEPELVALFAELRERIMNGRGVVLVTGLDASRLDADALERALWAIGTHLGVAAVQSRDGDRLGRVERDDTDPVTRGYRSAGELSMHTDSYEVLGLMCVRQAARGGVSALVSSLAIHNVLLAERPDLLPPLYAGYRMAIPEARLGSEPVTQQSIPVFCNVDGTVSCMFAAGFMREAARLRGEPLPPGLDEALRVFMEIANREDLALRFTLEPGEIALMHDFTTLHSRTEFENDATHKRLLLRLWLSVPDGRRFVPEFHVRGRAYDKVYSEYARRRGAPPAAGDSAAATGG